MFEFVVANFFRHLEIVYIDSESLGDASIHCREEILFECFKSAPTKLSPITHKSPLTLIIGPFLNLKWQNLSTWAMSQFTVGRRFCLSVFTVPPKKPQSA
jgi:hypothetical protein